jgi:hypothetical protein
VTNVTVCREKHHPQTAGTVITQRLIRRGRLNRGLHLVVQVAGGDEGEAGVGQNRAGWGSETGRFLAGTESE